MTADAKVGLLLGLLFIVVIAFLLNGPGGFWKRDKPVIETAVINQPGKTIRIDQAVAEAARDLNPVPLRQSDPPQEIQMLDNFSPEPEIVPVQTTPASPSALPASVRQVFPPTASASATRSHTVQKGENLAVIAVRHYGKDTGNKRATIQKLFEINRSILDSPDTIRVGDRLTVPSLEELFTPVPARSIKVEKGFLDKLKDVFEPDRAPASSDSYREYVVQSGDRLWDIAEQYMGDGKRYIELVSLNRKQIKDPDHVPAGITLKIPVR